MTELSPAILRWVERCAGTGTRVVSVTQMPPSATEKHVLVVAGGGSELRLVLRRYVDAVRLGVDPAYDPANEALALRLLEPTAVPAPRLVASDLDPEICDVPALLESWVPGAPAWAPTDLDAYLSSAAEVLVAIHAVAPVRPGGFPDYVPHAVADGIVPEPPSWSTRAGLWERVLDVLATTAPPEPAACFIHRDYHPGNALAEHGRVVSVVDWATAAWGPPGIDLARMRMNLAEEVGPDRADRFLDAYRIAGGAPADRHPYWDLLDAATRCSTRSRRGPQTRRTPPGASKRGSTACSPRSDPALSPAPSPERGERGRSEPEVRRVDRALRCLVQRDGPRLQRR